MLVFVSDLHLTDGNSGETIKAGAFMKFTQYLEDLVLTAKATKVEIVLLGDIFDVIRSNHWLDAQIRPWSGPDEADGNGNGIKEYTLEVVNRICGNQINVDSMKHLKEFKSKMKEQGIEITYTYIVGNHDWLINRYPETRVQIAEFVGMENPQSYNDKKFLLEEFWSDYSVFARHGDIFDKFNYDGDRDASSLGDAIVIDLLNKFPDAVENDIGPATDPELIKKLREIDNVRPLLDIPKWIDGICRTAKPEIEKRIKKVWDDLADQFLKIDFVKQHDTWYPFDMVDFLEAGLKFSKFVSFSDVAGINTKFLQNFRRSNYEKEAFSERLMRENQARFVIYGHTHDHKVELLDQVPKGEETFEKIYMNTGTWRRVHEMARFDPKSMEFSSWDVMTFIAFYLEDERDDRKFEIWNGALG